MGYQKNRGKGRLRGLYGAELAVMLGPGGGASTLTYSVMTPPVGNSKDTKFEFGSTFGVGINGFIGAECFFAPKMSLGAEYGWGLVFSSTGETTTTHTDWDTAGVPTTTTFKGQKSSSFNLDVINAGSLVLRAYF